jgi:transcriptional regulator with XRE-family HTH domain
MLIGQRLRELRESKNLSQGDIERRTGLLRCYVSRVENGHTVPAVETLEKFARALAVPIYEIFHDGKAPVTKLSLPRSDDVEVSLWGAKPRERRELKLFAKALARMNRRNRDLLMKMATTMADTRYQAEQS